MRLTSAATQSNTFCNWRYGLHRNDCAPQAILQCRLVTAPPVNPSPGIQSGNMPSTSSSRGDDEQMNGGRRQEHPPQIYMTIAIYPATDRDRSVWCPSSNRKCIPF